MPVGERDRVFDWLAQFVPPPAGVTREGIRAGQREMLDQWWDALGLGTVSWWRTWTREWKGKWLSFSPFFIGQTLVPFESPVLTSLIE